MTGGDCAPGWLFEKIGIDYRRLAESGTAHVMQDLYDYARSGRQNDRYPTMSWAQNARRRLPLSSEYLRINSYSN